jgi:hypothetical protein
VAGGAAAATAAAGGAAAAAGIVGIGSAGGAGVALVICAALAAAAVAAPTAAVLAALAVASATSEAARRCKRRKERADKTLVQSCDDITHNANSFFSFSPLSYFLDFSLFLSSLLFFPISSLHFSIRTYLCECLLLLQGVCVALRKLREAFGHLVVLRLELPVKRGRRRGGEGVERERTR